MREYGWPGQEQAPFFIEQLRFDRRSGTRGGAKEDNKPEGCRAVERFEEGILPDGIIDDVGFFASCGFQKRSRPILPGIVDGYAAAGLTGHCAFFLGTCRPDHKGAQPFGPPAQNLPDATCRRMNENDLAGLDRMGFLQQVLCRQPLEQERRSLPHRTLREECRPAARPARCDNRRRRRDRHSCRQPGLPDGDGRLRGQRPPRRLPLHGRDLSAAEADRRPCAGRHQ